MHKVKKGFTLIELILSLAILSIALSAIFAFFNFNTSGINKADIEIELQREGEKAIEEMTNIAIQSNKVTEIKDVDGNHLTGDISSLLEGDGLLPINDIVFKKDMDFYWFQLDGNKVLHLHYSGADTVVAENIDKIKLKLQSNDLEPDKLHLLDIEIELTKDGIEKTLETKILLRNHEK